MANVMMPQKRGSGLGQMLQLGGAVAGGVMGGPGGALVGAQAGGMVDGFLGGNKGPVAPVQTSAVQRRIDAQSPAQQTSQDLAAADQALASLPEPMQQQYRPALQRARYLESQGKGVA